MRRVHLRGRTNILKRLLLQGSGFNLSLLLRKLLGAGKPRQFQGLRIQLSCLFLSVAKLRAEIQACSWDFFALLNPKMRGARIEIDA